MPKKTFEGMTLPEALRYQLERDGITHRFLADRLNTNSANVSRWISLGSQPTAAFYDGLCDFLRITIEELSVLIIATEIEKANRGPL